MRALRNELGRIEGSIIRDRVKAVEEALSRNRVLLFVGQEEEDLNEDIDKLMVSECPKGQRPACMEKFKALSIQGLNLMRNAGQTEVVGDLDTKIETVGEIIEKVKGLPCEVCNSNFQKKLRKEKRAYQTIVIVEKASDKQSERELNFSFIVDTVIEPLANSDRLKILTGLCEGKKSYSRLAQITGLRGGHLTFHIRKLSGAGLIAQEDSKGDYVITERGLEVAKKVSLLEL
jgi:DNA-binding transcriptional ArsR family regulator